jgi:hypothetical protein
MLATRFAAPSFLFAEPALPVGHVRMCTKREVADLKVGTTKVSPLGPAAGVAAAVSVQ